MVLQLADRVELLTTENIKLIHCKLMRSSKIKIVDGPGCSGAIQYINAGFTRLATQKSAVVRSHQYNLAYCPVELVDQQLDYICKMGRVRLALAPFLPLLNEGSNTLRAGGIRLRPRRGSM